MIREFTMRFRLLVAFSLLVAVAFVWLPKAQASQPPVDTKVFGSPINGSCYLVTPSVCKIRVEPFTINIASGTSLVAFQMQANGQTVYDFRTDVSNPPAAAYQPSPVKLDFAATCGKQYVINLLAMDTGSSIFVNAGQTNTIACPDGTFENFAPLIIR